ncbi:hypothetical protein HMPREF1548_06323 [Clostridium sp. KLE 1755]|nr:hypothetical protein HMPREF1548_06323 [Clostridium sp. KLE 1755]
MSRHSGPDSYLPVPGPAPGFSFRYVSPPVTFIIGEAAFSKVRECVKTDMNSVIFGGN